MPKSSEFNTLETKVGTKLLILANTGLSMKENKYRKRRGAISITISM